eukprot:g22168.t1
MASEVLKFAWMQFLAFLIPTWEFNSFKIFKVQLYTLSRCYYFGVKGLENSAGRPKDEGLERASWVCDISTTVRLVTQSLFPPFRILCDPLSAVEETQRRLLAGYLIRSDSQCTISVLYCELRAHHGNQAMLVLYENETCEVPVTSIVLTADAVVAEKIGINCSCFSARTPSQGRVLGPCVCASNGARKRSSFSVPEIIGRKLWLRAISNIKVKLANAAPSPSSSELMHFREAIKEHLQEIRATLQCKVRTDALLPPSPHNTFQAQLTPFSVGLWTQVEAHERRGVAAEVEGSEDVDLGRTNPAL